MFGHCLDTLNHPTFSDPLLMNIQVALPLLWVIKAFPWAPSVLSIVPGWLGNSLHRRFAAFLYLRDYVVAGLRRILKDSARHPTIHSEKPEFSILPRLMETSRQDPSFSQCLVDESLSLLQAGSDTVGNTCTVGAFFILNDEAVRSKLVEELRSVWPDKDSIIGLRVLQNLPYLVRSPILFCLR
jgi:cytochrome P450